MRYKIYNICLLLNLGLLFSAPTELQKFAHFVQHTEGERTLSFEPGQFSVNYFHTERDPMGRTKDGLWDYLIVMVRYGKSLPKVLAAANALDPRVFFEKPQGAEEAAFLFYGAPDCIARLTVFYAGMILRFLYLHYTTENPDNKVDTLRHMPKLFKQLDNPNYPLDPRMVEFGLAQVVRDFLRDPKLVATWGKLPDSEASWIIRHFVPFYAVITGPNIMLSMLCNRSLDLALNYEDLEEVCGTDALVGLKQEDCIRLKDKINEALAALPQECWGATGDDLATKDGLIMIGIICAFVFVMSRIFGS